MINYGKPVRRVIRGRREKYYLVPAYDPATKKQKWISTRCEKKKAADEWVRTREIEQALGKERVEYRDTPTFDTAATLWLASKQDRVSDKYLLELKQKVDGYWVKRFGGLRLEDISAEDIRRYLSDRKRLRFAGNPNPKSGGRAQGAKSKKHLSGTTINIELRSLKGFFNFCVREGLIANSPAAKVEFSNAEFKRKIRMLTAEQEGELLVACKGETEKGVEARRNLGGVVGGVCSLEKSAFKNRWKAPQYLYPAVALALETGFRKRTLLSLTWAHVDLGASYWRIPGELMKAGRDYSAPMSAGARDILCELQASPISNSESILGLSPTASLTKAFKAATIRAKLEGLTFHCLRRIFTNKLCSSGVGIEIAMAITDHKSLETVLAHYREVSRSELESAMEKFSGS